MSPHGEPRARSRPWAAPPVWAVSQDSSANPIRQLIAPASIFEVIHGEPGSLAISNEYGVWPVDSATRVGDDNRLTVRVPFGTEPGDIRCMPQWVRPSILSPDPPELVAQSFAANLDLGELLRPEGALRTAQRGALHALLGDWTTGSVSPSTVAMPTGTGKTDTMIALLVAAAIPRLLVLVPSQALRDQLASKFESLGVLQALGVVGPGARRPVIGRVEHGISGASEASDFAHACNVVVATPQALSEFSDEVLAAFTESFTHLFVDEAHHVAAASWARVRDAFTGKPVVQFTATPFREDGQSLAGRIVYAFPLREAQRAGYFAPIAYKAVFASIEPDRELATEALARLRAELGDGLDHVLMARTRSHERAKELKRLYAELAPELAPVELTTGISTKERKAALAQLESRATRVIVCVDMLGEGFDLPSLKVAAIHDARKSLAVTLQLIGRFARTSTSAKIGGASVFVIRKDYISDPVLRRLYSEDADWNVVVSDLTDAAVAEQVESASFARRFVGGPDALPIENVRPKLSTVVYRTSTGDWSPEAALECFGEESVLSSSVAVNTEDNVAWLIVERHSLVDWADTEGLAQTSFELYLLYFDANHRLLYINNSANDGVFQELADRVAPPAPVRFDNTAVYRVMAGYSRLVATNVGVLDVRNQFRRFSMHVGADVAESFSAVESGTKVQTNISAVGYRDGERVSISASRKGRIWSHAVARSVRDWTRWCDLVGAKLLDETISVDAVIQNFIRPEILTQLPDATVLAVEWHPSVLDVSPDWIRLRSGASERALVFCEISPVRGNSTTSAYAFQVIGGDWTAQFEARIESGLLCVRQTSGPGVVVVRGRSDLDLAAWLEATGVLFILEGDRVVDGCQLYAMPIEPSPIAGTSLKVLDWAGTDLKVESQTAARKPESIQYRVASELLLDPSGWDVLLDDDGPGEIADLVGIRIRNDELQVRLVHCKYSMEETPGARIDDLYDVCGQAQKSARWRNGDLEPMFERLKFRAERRHTREGISPFLAGDLTALIKIHDRSSAFRRRFEVWVVQPGLSASKASSQQLTLLGATDNFLRTTVNSPIEVWCSA